MRDKLTTLETKRARRVKQFSPRFDIRALEAELRKENRNVSVINSSYRMDFGRLGTNERTEK